MCRSGLTHLERKVAFGLAIVDDLDLLHLLHSEVGLEVSRSFVFGFAGD